MAEYTYTSPITQPSEVGFALDRIIVHRNGAVDIVIVAKNSGDQTIRTVGILRVKADASGTDALVPATQLQNIRQWIWARLPNTFAAAGLSAPPAGTGT